MAQYKVPQDVEADDKLIGPFSFRQFVYLMIAAGLGFVAFLLFQIFPLLVIIPIPIIIFLGILALPLKKDQPMETYLSAVVDFYLKPQKRVWMPGQSDTAITVTAPKVVEENRTKDLSQEEASHRLSFLANIVDTEGYAIKETNSNLRDDVANEAAEMQDIYEKSQSYNLNQTLEQNNATHHAQLVEQMRDAINKNSIYGDAPHETPTITHQTPVPEPVAFQPPVMPTYNPEPTTGYESLPPQMQAMSPINTMTGQVNVAASAATIQPDIDEIHDALSKPASVEEVAAVEEQSAPAPEPIPEPEAPPVPDADMQNLANNTDFSIETIAQQARRIQEKKGNDNEVYISLH